MESQYKNPFLNAEQLAKNRQREALENLGTNFVDPHIQQLMSVPSHTPTIPAYPVVGFGCAAVWLLVTFVCCWMMGKIYGK
ncbi:MULTISPECIES: hypothetical protein [unclassified Roseofilum]|uniref:hypothetical protein n=1 Tax=unclassified Roseofilum TaxID=2620099 RepID=UPI000E99424D|nr:MULTISPECIES: hypothetical protein [unclassified Roseofilum]HBR00734.1 hypothetical protein [Cyanobacteria bacterium UBA11691]MBP0010490.1 hypothetical protein [Roseofilum sp. Belize Diploria]MBP0011627.1 hypothetical protein [Roseofilum sp. SID3]MBP0026637.1 hypothetical protein [Roseofilum sp. SID2]MBP0032214.1 hypothetical protein [Roseofilum sp. Belize BBD 4]